MEREEIKQGHQRALLPAADWPPSSAQLGVEKEETFQKKLTLPHQDAKEAGGLSFMTQSYNHD